MSETEPASQPRAPVAWTTRHTVLIFLFPLLIAVGVLGVILLSCVPAREAATAFVTALHDGRIEDMRGLSTPQLRMHLGLETPVATPPLDPRRTIALIRAAQRVEIDGVVQSGFGDNFALFHCFDGKLDDAAPFWIVMRKVDGAWLVEALASKEPELCKGG
jgi:hypothetical protein